jgi:hypothetical protein
MLAVGWSPNSKNVSGAAADVKYIGQVTTADVTRRGRSARYLIYKSSKRMSLSLVRFGDAGVGRRQGALAAQLGRFADIHLEGAVIVLGRREFPEFSVALEQPKRSGDDPDADAWIPGLQPLQGRDSHAETYGPRFKGFLAAQAGHREVCAQLFKGSRRCRREL